MKFEKVIFSFLKRLFTGELFVAITENEAFLSWTLIKFLMCSGFCLLFMICSNSVLVLLPINILSFLVTYIFKLSIKISSAENPFNCKDFLFVLSKVKIESDNLVVKLKTVSFLESIPIYIGCFVFRFFIKANCATVF